MDLSSDTDHGAKLQKLQEVAQLTRSCKVAQELPRHNSLIKESNVQTILKKSIDLAMVSLMISLQRHSAHIYQWSMFLLGRALIFNDVVSMRPLSFYDFLRTL